MIFYKTKTILESAHYLSTLLNDLLNSGKHVLWLVPGGSGIDVAVAASNAIDNQYRNNLVITLTDERYGNPDHPDSNEYQIKKAGFNLSIGKFIPVLNGSDITATSESFSKSLRDCFKICDYAVGLFGIGSDGHTAGIKPGSLAVNSADLVENFIGEDFERITITPVSIKKLDEVVLFAMGKDKEIQLKRLSGDIDVAVQPAQALKMVKKISIFNNFIGVKYESR